MLEKLKTYFKAIFSATSKKKKRQLTFDVWDTAQYYSAVYQVALVTDNPRTFAAFVCLFFGEPQKNLNKEDVLLIPLDIVYNTPEEVFVHLQILGPMYINTSQDVIVTEPIKDKENMLQVVKIWNLKKTLTEQGIAIPAAFALPTANDEIAPTHMGNMSIN